MKFSAILETRPTFLNPPSTDPESVYRDDEEYPNPADVAEKALASFAEAAAARADEAWDGALPDVNRRRAYENALRSVERVYVRRRDGVGHVLVYTYDHGNYTDRVRRAGLYLVGKIF